jgi:hypothetical protein
MNFIYFKLQYKKNTTMDDKVYSKISKINFNYQVIWLMWNLKLSGGNSNNKWKRVDHGATFSCLLQLSSHKIKYGPKEHHQTISNSQHQNKHTHETINMHIDPTLPPDDRQNNPRQQTAAALLLLIFITLIPQYQWYQTNILKISRLNKLQLLYSKDNQSLPSTIFNQAHNGKLYSEHRQQGTQLQNFITCKPLYKNSCLNTLWKEEDIYYKTSHISNTRYGI